MPLITVNIPEKLGTDLLDLLRRLVTAVERIAGPELVYTPPTPATLRDYALVPPDEALRVQEAERDFAARHLVVPGSPAYVAAIEEFERQVAAAYGEDAVYDLPWKVHSTPPIPIEEIPPAGLK